MNIEPIAYFHSPMTSKFGVPRQSGVVQDLPGRIVFEPAYRNADAVRGLDAFDCLWLIWGFSANRGEAVGLTVRPPRLGGNERVGVFASRSPYRPNGLGLSSIYINNVELSPTLGPVIHVLGADLMDGTPIYDIKPYIPYTDAHPDARAGFTDERQWTQLHVEVTAEVEARLKEDGFARLKQQFEVCKQLLSQDPRPHYHDSPERVYNMEFGGYDISFKVRGGQLLVIEVRLQN